MKKSRWGFCFGIFALICLLIFPTSIEAASVKINKTKATVYVGNTITLKITGTSKKVKWTSTNKKIATVSQKGKVTAKKKGTVTIKATVGGKTYKCKVSVKNPYISKEKLSLKIGKSTTLKLYGTKIKSVSTSNKLVATISKSGKVTAKKAGTAIITLRGTNKKSYQCKVTVNHDHNYKWEITKQPSETLAKKVSDFGERRMVCSCGVVKTKETMINIGDQIVCGVFDDAQAKDLFDIINEARRFCWTWETDIWGNYIETISPCQLKEAESLNVIAKIRAAEASIEFSLDKKRTKWELLASGRETAHETYKDWTEEDGCRRVMTDTEVTETGTACFWYDAEGTGEYLWPIWVQVFEGDGLPPIEPDEESKEIIENNKNGIPDKAFYNAAVKRYDRNGDGKLSKGEAARPGEITFSGLDIKNLTGVHYFVNASNMDFSNNKITDLSPLKKIGDILCELDLSNNQIKNLKPLANVRLRELNLANNKITDITRLKRTGNEFYWYLSLAGNSVKDISPLAGVTVQHFDWSNNGVKDISKLKNLNLNNMFKLDLSNNKIADISVLDGFGTNRTKMTSVDFINLSNNKIKTLKGTIQADFINLSHNQLTSLKDKSKKGSASKLAAITMNLDVSHNKLTDLSPIIEYYDATPLSLDASYNKISNISALKKMVIVSLNLSHNKIKDITPLKTATIAEIRSQSDTEYHRTVDLTYNQITTLKPLRNSRFLKSMEKRIKMQPETFYLTFINYYGDDYTYNDFKIAEGNKITLADAKKYLSSTLLNAKLYYPLSEVLGKSAEKVATPITWISQQPFKNATAINKSKDGLIKENGILKYYKKGKIDYKYCGLASYNGKKYYVSAGQARTSVDAVYLELKDGRTHLMKKTGENFKFDVEISNVYYITNGVVDTSFTGVVKVQEYTHDNQGRYYYLTKGVWDRTYSGVGVLEEPYYSTTKLMPRYFKNGIIDTSYNGFVRYENYCWKLEKGVFKEDVTGLVADEKGTYWFYVDGVLNIQYEGIVTEENSGIMYLVRNGKVAIDYTGIFEGKVYPYDDVYIYYVEKGVVGDYNGLVDYKGDTYLIKNGRVDTSAFGLYLIDGEPYDFKSGKVNKACNGVVEYKQYTQYYYWVMKEGRRDKSFTGLTKMGQYSSGVDRWGYFTEGTFDITFTGLVKTTINSEAGEWFVLRGILSYYTGVYIDEESPLNGVYVENGKHIPDFEGIGDSFCADLNKWYVKNGYVQFDYTGGRRFGSYYYRIANGRVTSYSRA